MARHGSLFRWGLLTVLTYLLAFTLPYWLPSHYLNVKDELFQFAAREPWRGVLFYAALLALFALYLAAYRRAKQDRTPVGFWQVGAWTLVFCLLLIPVQPLTSSDVYGYVFQGRIVAAHGQNPFAHVFSDFSADPFYPLVTFYHLPASTGYGPFWIAITGGLGWLARNRLLLNLVLFKALAAGLHLLAAGLVYATLKRLAPGRALAGMLFYAWNPLLLHELVGNAHNDAAVVALALLGFYLLSRERGLWAIPCFAAAALVKPVALLWLPLLAVWLLAQAEPGPARLRRGVAVAGLALAPAVAAYAPFWAGADTFRGLLAQSDIHGNSLPNLLIFGLQSVWPGGEPEIVAGVKLLTVAVFVPFYAWQLWKSRRDVLRPAFDVMLFYLLFVGFQFQPWYAAWLVAPAALLVEPTRRRLALALCLLAPLLYFPFGWQWAKSHLPAWTIAFLSSLPLLGLAAWLGLRAWRRFRVR